MMNAAIKPWAPFDIDMNVTVASALTRATESNPILNTQAFVCGMILIPNAILRAAIALPTSKEVNKHRPNIYMDG